MPGASYSYQHIYEQTRSTRRGAPRTVARRLVGQGGQGRAGVGRGGQGRAGALAWRKTRNKHTELLTDLEWGVSWWRWVPSVRPSGAGWCLLPCHGAGDRRMNAPHPPGEGKGGERVGQGCGQLSRAALAQCCRCSTQGFRVGCCSTQGMRWQQHPGARRAGRCQSRL